MKGVRLSPCGLHNVSHESTLANNTAGGGGSIIGVGNFNLGVNLERRGK